MVREYRNNVWVVRTGYCGKQEMACLERGFISLDLNLHLMDIIRDDLPDLEYHSQHYNRHAHFENKYKEFDRDFRKEFNDAIRNVDYTADREEIVKKMKKLNQKLSKFDEQVKQFDATMHEFDEFEIVEQMKLSITDKLSSLPVNLLDSWSRDILNFVNGIRVHDLVMMPVSSDSSVAIGRIKDNYYYKKGAGMLSHRRRVDWHDTRLPFDRMFPGFEDILGLERSITLIEDYNRDFVLDIIKDNTF